MLIEKANKLRIKLGNSDWVLLAYYLLSITQS
jgi:hypothetical protein